MTGYYDDNFGWYEIESEEDIEFYHQMQATNVEKECQRCDKVVNIQPDYAFCNACADAIERGMDF